MAAQNGACVISKDADFGLRTELDDRVPVVWVRCGNLRLADFKVWFDSRRDAMVALLALGERLIELR